MSKSIFEKIADRTADAFIVWENDDYISFMSIFPNTPGHTVVAPKNNPGDYVFAVESGIVNGLMDAARQTAKLLEKAFDTDRVGVIFHGLGVAHLHAQLVPFHANLDQDPEKAAAFRQDNPQFAHELTALDGPRMDDGALRKYQKMILEKDTE